MIDFNKSYEICLQETAHLKNIGKSLPLGPLADLILDITRSLDDRLTIMKHEYEQKGEI
jgi:hypothetical protein